MGNVDTAVNAILSTARTPQLSLYAWMLAMHSQLPAATVSYTMGDVASETIDGHNVDATASTQRACFSDTLSRNANMHEIVAALDTIPHVVKLMVEEMRMDNVAILYDGVFGRINTQV